MCFSHRSRLVCYHIIVYSCLCCSAISLGQTTDIARLVHPAVAERLSLSDQQRAKLQQLVLERAIALAAATDKTAETDIHQTFETRARELLTPLQIAKLAEDQPNHQLSFQFRDMKWEQVLAWFADQQDLTLVMDRIPPGSFTYSDTRTYSPAEAIDLLNSVLMTRGFSLVRREKMLTVMELNDALPIELLPRVTLDQLPQRGRFELVSVVFPLAGRPIDAVLNEIKPYLNSYGRAVPLAQGSQVLVIENAGKMQTINELIASVAVPKKDTPPTPAPAPQPVLASYPLGKLDGATTLAFLRKLIPSENITFDEKAGILSAYVIPTQHTALQSALTTLQDKQAEMPSLQSVAYKLSGTKSADFVTHVTSLFPQAKVLTTADQALVIATASDQEKIRESLAALKMNPIQSELAMRVFEVSAVDAAAVETGLKKFLPDSQVTANEATGTIILRGTASDLLAAEEIIQIWKRTASAKQLQLRTFALDAKANAEWLATALRIVPNAKLWLSPNKSQLLMLADPPDVVSLEAVLPQLQTLLPDFSEQKRLVPQSYVLTVKDHATVLSLLSTDFPDVKFSLNEDRTQITALAESGLQDSIQARILQFNQALPAREPETVATYQVPGMTAEQLQSALSRLLGKATVQVDDQRARLLVWASPTQHADIAKTVQLLSEQPTIDNQKIVMAYPLESASATAVQTLLSKLDSEITIVADDKLKQLVVTGTLAKQAVIQSAIKQIDRPTSSSGAPEIRGFDIKSYNASQILPALQSLWPDVQMSVDTATNKIIATASPQKLELFGQAIEKMTTAPAGKQPVVRTYFVPVGDMTTLPAILTQIAPQATLSSDPVSRTVTVLASEELQARVQEALQQIGSNSQAAKRPASYQLRPAQLTAAQTALQSLFPGIGLAADTTTGQIVVVANEQLHEQIASVIDLLAKGPHAAERTVRVFPLKGRWLDTPAFLKTLESLIPSQISLQSSPSTESIIAIGTIDELKIVEQQLAQLSAQYPAGQEMKSAVFRLKHAAPATVIRVVAPIVPQAIMAQDTATDSLAISAFPNDLQKVEELIRLLDVAKQSDQITRSYRLKRGSGRGLAILLGQVVTDAKFYGDVGSGALLASATEEQHKKIQEIILEYEGQIGELESRVFSLGKADARSLQNAIEDWSSTARVAVDRESNSLFVTAPKNVMTQIEDMVREVDGDQSEAQVTSFYPVNSADPVATARSLQVNYPKALISGDVSGGGVFVTASLEEHKLIAAVIEQVNAVPSKLPSLKSFSIQHVTAASVARGLIDAFGRRSEVGVTISEPTNAVFVVGSRASLQIAENIITQLDVPSSNRPTRSLRVFSIEGMDDEVVVEAIESALQHDPHKVDVSYDSSSSRVFITAEPAQFVQIEQVLESLKPEPRELQVLPLAGLDPYVAKEAIDSLFFDTSYRLSPVITVDQDRQQLLIKASAEQHKQVRSLIEQMGNADHSSLGPSPNVPGQNNTSSQIRFVPISRNSQRVLDELQKVWPTLRKNPLRVVQPAGQTPAGKSPQSTGQKSDDSGAAINGGRTRFVSQAQSTIVSPTDDSEDAPIVVVTGETQWTLASEDVNALTELERVLELMRGSRAIPYLSSGNYSVYLLRQASADEVQETLEQLLRTDRSSEVRRSTSISNLARRVRIVADVRTNALIVSGSPTDRELVEELLGVLDSDEMIGSLQQLLPTSILLQSANATQVEAILRGIYRAQLATSSSRKPISIPEGVSAEVSTLLRQLNAESASPLLTLIADEITNSIIIRAPHELTEEIRRFVSSLDGQTASTPSRRVDLIRLKSTNTESIRAALQRLMAK